MYTCDNWKHSRKRFYLYSFSIINISRESPERAASFDIFISKITSSLPHEKIKVDFFPLQNVFLTSFAKVLGYVDFFNKL
jgi:hypothetical protein